MDSRDLIHVLRLWLPDGKSVAGVREDLAEQMAAAFAEFDASAPGSGIDGPAEILPQAAAAAARGLLQEAVREAKGQPADPIPSEPLKGVLTKLEWADLFLAAACAARNDAANRQLLEMIQRQVQPALARKWGYDRAEEITDDLPQNLHLFDERGLNRGRPRLLAYGGRSRLVTWLRAIAHQGAIDRWRRQIREQPDDDLSDAPAGGDGSSADGLADRELLELIRRVVPAAFEQLMRQLPAVSEQQHRFAYLRCVERLDNAEIAKRVGVAKSRVTELSQQVFRRLLAIIRALAPELGEVSDEASRARRRNVEEALQEWFGQGEPKLAGSARPGAASVIERPTERPSGAQGAEG